MTAAVRLPDRSVLPWRTAVMTVLLGAVVFVSATAALHAVRDVGRASPIWLANAFTVVAVLKARDGRWPLWLAAGFLGNIAAALASGDVLATALALSGCNTLEALICGVAVRRLFPSGFDASRMGHLAIGAGVALAASFSAALAAVAYRGLLHAPNLGGELAIWTLADFLGLVILAPCLMILADWRRFWAERPTPATDLLIVAAILGLEFGIILQPWFPLFFLVPLVTLTASMMLDMLGAAILVLATAGVVLGFAFAGRWPMLLAQVGWTERLILTQVFVAVFSCLNLQVAALQQHRRQGARALAAALAQAEQAARVKSEFLANMSHEIRTPLTSILGFASLLAEKDIGEEAGRYADRILGASRNLLALVNDVLDFSRLEAGKLELKPAAGSPAQCGRDVTELFAPQAAQKGLSIRFEAADLPPLVTADFDRVRQVLMNLVGNAVKFTAMGGVRVIAGYDAAAGRLAFRVIDTGAGLDAAGLAKLFQRFSQVDAGIDRAHGGSGLGLAISKGLVEAMGGTIGVESRLGAGSTFWFEVPAEVAAEPQAAAEPGLDPHAFVGLKVLLVDDNAANRELIRSLMTPLGVDLTTADGGEAAISLASREDFELILMDLRMPGVDGWTAARRIRAWGGRNRATPILAFSADISADDSEALSVFEGVVRKPIEMAGLLAAIAHWTAEPPARARAAAH